jgi:hypothetical protein
MEELRVKEAKGKISSKIFLTEPPVRQPGFCNGWSETKDIRDSRNNLYSLLVLPVTILLFIDTSIGVKLRDSKVKKVY